MKRTIAAMALMLLAACGSPQEQPAGVMDYYIHCPDNPKGAVITLPWVKGVDTPALQAFGYCTASVDYDNLHGTAQADEAITWLYDQLPYERVGLLVASRGGRSIKWAHDHPERVSWILALAPALSNDSWPYNSLIDGHNPPFNIDSQMEWEPVDHAAEFSTPILLYVGSEDTTAPTADAVRFISDYAGAYAEIVVVEGVAHNVLALPVWADIENFITEVE